MISARTLPEGAKVTEPGVYDIPIERYHTQCCDGISLSSSGIRRLLKSPAHFWKHSELNPNRVDEGSKEAFVLGRAAHHLLLGETAFGKHFAVRPDIVDNEPWQGNRKACKAWIAKQELAGLTVLTPTHIEQIRGMAGLLPWQQGMTNCGLQNTPLVTDGALAGEIEKSLFWKVGDIWLKARPDAIPNDSNDYSDLKTITSRSGQGLSSFDVRRAIFDHKLFVQGAMVGMGLGPALGRTLEGFHFHLIFVETTDLHAVDPVTLSDTDLVLGERAVHVALDVFKRCMDSGIWPGPTARTADARVMPISDDNHKNFSAYLDVIEQEFVA